MLIYMYIYALYTVLNVKLLCINFGKYTTCYNKTRNAEKKTTGRSSQRVVDKQEELVYEQGNT